MKKVLLLFLLLCAQVTLVKAQRTESAAIVDTKMEWWREARFGMFIHWGPYSVLGGMYKGHEQRRGGAGRNGS